MGSANIKFIRIEGNAAPQGNVVPQGNAAAQLASQAPAPAASSAAPIDPTQFGAEGGGGTASAESLALLDNKNLVFDSDGIADIKAGKIDPRVVAVLTKLSSEHKITVTCMCSDHDKFTAGGSVSNHHFGRGMDIGTIDGEIVGPGSPLAREVASELSSLNPEYRPNEIGSPFAIAGPGYFTDAAHQNHLHIGFKEQISADWKPPSDVAAAPTAAPVATAAAVAPGSPAAVAAAVEAKPERKHQSQLFQKVASASAAAKEAGDARKSASGLFQKVEAPPKAAAAAVDPAAAQPAAAQPAAAAAAVDPAAAAQAVAAAAPDAYPGDSAPREQIAAWMAGQAEKRGLPAQLPLMASLVESNMTNIQGGDADSVGFFQMRVGIWNQGAYAGYPKNPELQVKWFLDQAEAVKRQRLVAGKSITDPNQFGEWIADVERPAAQYRGRYQLKLGEADGLLSQAPAQPAAAAAVPVAAPVDPAAAAASAAALGNAKLPPEILGPVEQAIAAGHAPGPKALAAIEEASKYIGTDYKFGGSTPQTGFDCSGLMQWAYAQSGVQIPRVTYTQIEAANGIEVADKANLKPGDLVFFSNAGDVHHVGMFLGGDKFLHAPHTGDVVKVSSLSEPYYASQFAGGRRFDNAAGVAAVPASAPAATPVAAAAAVTPAAPAAPAIDPAEVAKAQAAVARDAAEVRRNQSQLFQAVKAVEATKEREKRVSMMFLKAIDPSQVKRPEAAAAAAPPVTPPAEPAAAAASLPVESTPPPAPAPEAVAPAPPPEAAAAPPTETPAGKPVQAAAPVAIDLANTATGYPGDNASQAELAKWLAKQADAAGLPPELPVMASLVESGVKNLNFGDADSVGFFQMRVGIWNKGAYAGYPEKPELQAKWFIDQALAVKKQRLAAGKSVTDPEPVRRVDRRHRAPRRPVPRPLSAAARRGPQAAHVGLEARTRHAGRQVFPPRLAPRRRDLLGVRQEPDGVDHVPVGIERQPAARRDVSRAEAVGGPDAVEHRQRGAAVRDVEVGRAPGRLDPIHHAGHGAAVEEDVAGVEVAVQEARLEVRRGRLDGRERPFPHARVGRPLRHAPALRVRPVVVVARPPRRVDGVDRDERARERLRRLRVQPQRAGQQRHRQPRRGDGDQARRRNRRLREQTRAPPPRASAARPRACATAP